LFHRFPIKTVIYDKEGNEVKVVNEVVLNEIMPKGFMATRTGKRNMELRNDEAHCTMLKLLMPEIQKIKSILEIEVWQWKAPFDKMLRKC
jgi:hypothetical protein